MRWITTKSALCLWGVLQSASCMHRKQTGFTFFNC